MSILNKENGKLKVAVIEGWHPFEIPQWLELLKSFDDIDCYPQTIENWAFDLAECRNEYDVFLFYNMNMETDSSSFKEQLEKAFSLLGTTSQGIFMLHHSILAYPKSQLWSDIVGIKDRVFNFYPEQDIEIKTVNPAHPITRGMENWEIHDETYTMSEPEPDSEILLTADHSKSMKAIGWIRAYNKSRVFCFQCGHDHLAWENPEFRNIFANGIKWAARKL